MRKIFAAFLLILTFVTFSGCEAWEHGMEQGASQAEAFFQDFSSDFSFFEFVGQQRLSTGDLEFYRDTVTDVMYVIFDGYRSGNIAVMVDSYGLPMSYSMFCDLYMSEVSE